MRQPTSPAFCSLKTAFPHLVQDLKFRSRSNNPTMASSLSILALCLVALAPICLYSAAVPEAVLEVEDDHEVEKRQTTGCNIYCNKLNAQLCYSMGMLPITSLPPNPTNPNATLIWSITRTTAYVSLVVNNAPCGSVCYNCTSASFYSCTTPNVYQVYNTYRTYCATCYRCF